MAGNGAGDDPSGGGGSGAALKKGPWTAAEDAILMDYVKTHGEGNWNSVQKNSGLSRCGKSCRLRWANHLRPNLKKGSFSPDEERLILELHAKLGNKWARMAAQLPGRTDNEIKNYWNTRIKRRQRAGLPLYPPDIQRQASMNNQRGATSPTSPKPNYSSPLQLLDHTGFSTSTTPTHAPATTTTTGSLLGHLHNQTQPFLSASPVHRFKRFRETAPMVGFSLPFSSSPTPAPFFHQNLHTQHAQHQHQHQQHNYGSMQFNSGSFDLNPQILQSHFDHAAMALPQAAIHHSVKLELPSSQLQNIGPPLGTQTFKPSGIGVTITPLERSHSGLLDALLQEAQEIAPGGGGDESRRHLLSSEPLGKCGLDGWLPPASLPLQSSGGQWDDSSAEQSSIGIKAKKEGKEELNPVDEDLSSLLDLIPQTLPTGPEWYSDSGEASNGQSAATDDEIGLEMQHLASSLSATPTDQDWSLGSCTWNNMPGIC